MAAVTTLPFQVTTGAYTGKMFITLAPAKVLPSVNTIDKGKYCFNGGLHLVLDVYGTDVFMFKRLVNS
jgi:hypothetical protein